MPKVSVLMCVYNREDYLVDAIESILDQTLKDLELVIVNDGSTDGSGEIIKNYAMNDDRIKVLENSTNMGIIYSLTLGAQNCSAKYIARMDSDDISLPERLMVQYNYMESHPEIDAIGTGFDFIDADGKKTGKYLVRPADPMLVRYQMFYHCMIHHPTVMMKSKYYKKFNENHLEEDYVAAEDYHFWLRENSDLLYSNLSDRLLLYRIHSAQVSTEGLLTQRESILRSAHEAFEKLLNKQIPMEVIRTFYFIQRYETNDPTAVREAIGVIYQAQKAFEKKNELTRDQRHETRMYTYEKLKSVVVKYKKFPTVFLSGIFVLFKVLPCRLFSDLFVKFEKNR